MKRSSLITILSLLLVIPCFAQRSFDSHEIIANWNNEKIPDGSKIGVVFDYSNTLFKGLSYEDYCDLDEDFPKDIKESEARFIMRFSDSLSKLRKRTYYYSKNLEKADYILKIVPNSLDNNGNYKGEAVIKDKEGNIVASFVKISCIGGRIGSFTNLIGDGYQNLAGLIGETIQSGINKKKI